MKRDPWGSPTDMTVLADHYDTLTRAWREANGPIHPDDPDIGRAAR